MSELTHWKKLYNPDYLGAYSLEPGQDLVVTIASVRDESVMGTDGKKEECMVMRFSERNTKPMILNATNAKQITKLLNTPYIEKWAVRQIQLYATPVKAFGETVDALRIRPFLPLVASDKPIKCEDCGEVIRQYGKTSAAQLAEYTQRSYGRRLCPDCAAKAKAAKDQADEATDVLGAEQQEGSKNDEGGSNNDARNE